MGKTTLLLNKRKDRKRRIMKKNGKSGKEKVKNKSIQKTNI